MSADKVITTSSDAAIGCARLREEGNRTRDARFKNVNVIIDTPPLVLLLLLLNLFSFLFGPPRRLLRPRPRPLLRGPGPPGSDSRSPEKRGPEARRRPLVAALVRIHPRQARQARNRPALLGRGRRREGLGRGLGFPARRAGHLARAGAGSNVPHHHAEGQR